MGRFLIRSATAMALLCPLAACSPAEIEARHAYEATLRGIQASPDSCTKDLVGQFRAGPDNGTSYIRFTALCGDVVAFFNGARLDVPKDIGFPLQGRNTSPGWWRIDCAGLLVAKLPVKAEHHQAFLARCPGENRYWGFAHYVD